MRRRPGTSLIAVAVLVYATCGSAADPGSPEAESASFSPAQLEAIVAPIALYPDNLLTQVLIASTYPLEVVEAARWQTKNASLKGDDLQRALEAASWDDSVKWLVNFPDLLQRMSQNLDWTKDMGDAFLGQRDQLMDAVQRLRAQAYTSGNLKTTEQVTVVKEKEVIQIVPANPEVVYVPSYPPTAYGPTYVAPPQPYYPQSYWTTPAGVATTGIVSFGAGMLVGAAMGGAFDWDDHDVYVHNHYGGGGGGKNNTNVNINKNTNIVNSGNRWQHNADHRGGVRYRDDKVARKYDQARNPRNDAIARGREPGGGGGRQPGGAGSRPGRGDQTATRPPERPGGGPGAGGGRPDGRPETRPATRPASGGGRKSDAFESSGGGAKTRQASQRGAASRGTQSFAGKQGGGGGGKGGGGGGKGGGGSGKGGRGGRR